MVSFNTERLNPQRDVLHALIAVQLGLFTGLLEILQHSRNNSGLISSCSHSSNISGVDASLEDARCNWSEEDRVNARDGDEMCLHGVAMHIWL